MSFFFLDETVRCQHTSNPLGNGAIVETSDGKILLLKRSNNVGEFPGHFVFPGGHPEVNKESAVFLRFRLLRNVIPLDVLMHLSMCKYSLIFLKYQMDDSFPCFLRS